MSRSVREYLQHILDETRYLLNQAHGLDKEAFLADETLKRAFERLKHRRSAPVCRVKVRVREHMTNMSGPIVQHR